MLLESILYINIILKNQNLVMGLFGALSSLFRVITFQPPLVPRQVPVPKELRDEIIKKDKTKLIKIETKKKTFKESYDDEKNFEREKFEYVVPKSKPINIPVLNLTPLMAYNDVKGVKDIAFDAKGVKDVKKNLTYNEIVQKYGAKNNISTRDGKIYVNNRLVSNAL